MQEKIDISVLNRKIDFSIPPFFWIHPKNISGFSKTKTKQENIQLVLGENREPSSSDPADLIIAMYLEECLESHPEDYQLFLEYNLWLIVELYSSYVSSLSPMCLRPHLPHDKKILNQVFEKVFTLFSTKDMEQDYFCLFLLKNYIFELFQFGPEWGVFTKDKLDHPSMFQYNLAIDDINNTGLCSLLTETNVRKISSLLDVDFLDAFLNANFKP